MVRKVTLGNVKESPFSGLQDTAGPNYFRPVTYVRRTLIFYATKPMKYVSNVSSKGIRVGGDLWERSSQ